MADGSHGATDISVTSTKPPAAVSTRTSRGRSLSRWAMTHAELPPSTREPPVSDQTRRSGPSAYSSRLPVL